MEKKQKHIFMITKEKEKIDFIKSHTFNDIKIYSQNENNKKGKNKQNEVNKNENMTKIKVILNYSYQKDYFEFCLPAKMIYNEAQNVYQFCLNDILDLIHSYTNDKTIFLNENYSISYYTNDEKNDIAEEKENNTNTYFYIGKYPLAKKTNYYINIPADGILYLKFRKRISKIKSLRYDIFEEENEEEVEEENHNSAQLNYNTESKRAKEKRIGYIIKKVFEWKGYRKYTNNKMSLIDAANNVGLSKKTLDEYLNQIKEGKKYNFDFNRHKNDKVNILRGYVKKMNGYQGTNKKIGKKRKIKNK